MRACSVCDRNKTGVIFRLGKVSLVITVFQRLVIHLYNLAALCLRKIIFRYCVNTAMSQVPEYGMKRMDETDTFLLRRREK